MLSIATTLGSAVVALVGVHNRSRQTGLVWHLSFVPVFLVVFAAYGLYRDRRRRIAPSSFHDLVDIAHALTIGSICALGMAVLRMKLGHISGAAGLRTEEVITTAVVAMVYVPFGRLILNQLRAALGHSVKFRVLVLGSGQVADATIARLQRFPNVEVVGQIDDDVAVTPVLGSRSQLLEVCQRERVDRIIVAYSREPDRETVHLLREAAGSIHISIVPRLFELMTWRSQVEDLYGMPVIDIAPPQFTQAALFLKRVMDIAVAATLLATLTPVLAFTAVAIRVTSPGPILFRQDRRGKNGRVFRIFKFRTMRLGAETEREGMAADNVLDGPLFKVRKDPRLTSVGGFLRRYSIDELPQLFNVLIGHMTLVGPRPFVLPESDQITGWAQRRSWVRPGMTGLWQVSGRSELNFEDLRRLDYIYVTSWSLWWDLRILWQTPASVLHRDGAY